ncbi:MAG: hypothetical protein A2Z34_04295 [Planctomycetes bacterium RBG_16_59_8]|nr:MAG: hypothetical protein A2Z34_04295 [Planctomycetes bacterium RBG_16_59_8]
MALLKSWLVLISLVVVALVVLEPAIPPGRATAGDDMDERMEKYCESLGVECTFCHIDGEEDKWTRNKRVADYMQKEFVDKLLVQQNGKKVKITCQYCHKGKAKTIDRTPPPAGRGGNGPGGATGPNANKMWAIMQTFGKGLSVNCNYCHEAMNWSGDNGRKKTTRIMYKDYCVNIVKADGKVLACIDCHRGKPTFLPAAEAAPNGGNGKGNGKKK